MQMAEYQTLAQATLIDENGPTLINAALGLSGESGEVADLMKKHLFHNKWVTKEELLLEIGDVLYYVAMAAAALETSLDDLAEMNIRKLWKRYPARAMKFVMEHPDALNLHAFLPEEE